ncbi:hypothetical protein Rctr197k_125 [Virus Rctr197k]|nr:hypothetical protein Rctr197k_125 [Virus Rctr197k]
MKTWTTAIEAHRDRLSWCQNFRDVLFALEQAGAPPPDDVGAAHADWATIHGVLRISMTLKNCVVLIGPNARRFGPGVAEPETLNVCARAWAALLCEIYSGDILDPSTGLPQPAKSERQDHFQLYASDGEALVEGRSKPYWQPNKK